MKCETKIKKKEEEIFTWELVQGERETKREKNDYRLGGNSRRLLGFVNSLSFIESTRIKENLWLLD